MPDFKDTIRETFNRAVREAESKNQKLAEKERLAQELSALGHEKAKHFSDVEIKRRMFEISELLSQPMEFVHSGDAYSWKCSARFARLEAGARVEPYGVSGGGHFNSEVPGIDVDTTMKPAFVRLFVRVRSKAGIDLVPEQAEVFDTDKLNGAGAAWLEKTLNDMLPDMIVKRGEPKN